MLLLTDPVDEVWVDAVAEFDGKQLRSVAKGEVDLGTRGGEAGGRGPSARSSSEEYAGLLTWMTERLGEDVKEVRLSSRLTVSPACLVSDAHDVTPALENIYRAMGQEVPAHQAHPRTQPEPRPGHRPQPRTRERSPAAPELAETAELLLRPGPVGRGRRAERPGRFVKLMADRLERTL